MNAQNEKRTDFSAGGVVWDAAEKKVFLIKVENLAKEKRWTFPKGHPDAGESDKDAAVREVREESGWEAAIIKFILDVHYTYARAGLEYEKTVRWFLMRPVKQVGVPMPEEVLDHQWATLEEAASLVTYPSDQELLGRVKESIL